MHDKLIGLGFCCMIVVLVITTVEVFRAELVSIEGICIDSPGFEGEVATPCGWLGLCQKKVVLNCTRYWERGGPNAT